MKNYNDTALRVKNEVVGIMFRVVGGGSRTSSLNLPPVDWTIGLPCWYPSEIEKLSTVYQLVSCI